MDTTTTTTDTTTTTAPLPQGRPPEGRERRTVGMLPAAWDQAKRQQRRGESIGRTIERLILAAPL